MKKRPLNRNQILNCARALAKEVVNTDPRMFRSLPLNGKLIEFRFWVRKSVGSTPEIIGYHLDWRAHGEK